MGGGLSSLSKVCVVGRPSRADADVDYTFAQVSIRDARIDMSGNCGNMSAAIGPFVVDEGLVAAAGWPGDGAHPQHQHAKRSSIPPSWCATVARSSMATSQFPAWQAAARDQARVRTSRVARSPENCCRQATHRGARRPGVGRIDVSMIDAGNACVFVRAESLGPEGTETPEQIERDARLMEALLAIRAQASVAMRIHAGPGRGAREDHHAVDRHCLRAECVDGIERRGVRRRSGGSRVRMISSNQPHAPLPLTASLCVAVAANIPDTLVHTVARYPGRGPLKLGMPSVC